jgi:hypothetical protein
VPGFHAFMQATDTEANHAVLRTLGERLKDPAFGKDKGLRAKVDMRLLVAHPLDLRPCWAVRRMAVAR